MENLKKTQKRLKTLSRAGSIPVDRHLGYISDHRTLIQKGIPKEIKMCFGKMWEEMTKWKIVEFKAGELEVTIGVTGQRSKS